MASPNKPFTVGGRRGLSVSEAHRLRELEKENSRLKRIVADRDLEIDAMKELLTKKGRRSAAPSGSGVFAGTNNLPAAGLPVARLEPIELPLSSSSPAAGPVVERLKALAHRHPGYGYRRVTALLRREGQTINPKRVHRLWKQLGLSLHWRPKRKRRRGSGFGPPTVDVAQPRL